MNCKETMTKILIWATRIILVLFVCILLFIFVYSRTDSFQNFLRKNIETEFKEKVLYERASLRIIPSAGIVLHKVNFVTPEQLNINAESLKIHPRFPKILTGKFEAVKFTLKNPAIFLELDKITPKQKKDYSAGDIVEKINIALDEIRKEMPGLVCIIEKGSLIIRENNKEISNISNLNLLFALETEKVRVRIKGDLARWGEISLVGRFSAQDETLFINNASALFGESSVYDCSGWIKLKDNYSAELKAGETVLILDDIYKKLSLFENTRRIFGQVNNLKGRIVLSSLDLSGPLLKPQSWEIVTSGSVEGVVLGSADLPGTIKIAQGNLRVDQDRIDLDKFAASIFDSKFTLSAKLENAQKSVYAADVKIDGIAGGKTLGWIAEKLNLPPEHTLRGPLKIKNGHILWEKDKKLHAYGSAAINDGPHIYLDISKSSDTFDINKLVIRDEQSRADITLNISPRIVAFTFKGNLKEQTFNRIFAQKAFRRGWVRGDLSIMLLPDKYERSRLEGWLEGKDFILPLPAEVPLKFSHAVIRGEKTKITIEKAALKWGENNLDANGFITASPQGLGLSIDVKSDAIEVGAIIDNFEKIFAAPEKKQTLLPDVKMSVRGVIRIAAPQVKWGSYSAQPVSAAVLLNKDDVHLVFNRAFMCDIAIPGRIIFAKNDIKFDFQPDGASNQLENVLDCFFERNLRITGSYDFNALLNSRGKASGLIRALQGNAQLKAREGVIYKFPLLAKIFAFLNLTELLRGKLPDFRTQGFAYNSAIIKGDIRDGVLHIQEAVVDGKTMQLVGQGEIDLVTNQIKLTVLIAPFKTIDFLVSKIPGLRYILRGTLISIPLRVTGNIEDPDIIVLSPTAVGAGLLGVMQRTLKLPVKIIEPLLPMVNNGEK